MMKLLLIALVFSLISLATKADDYYNFPDKNDVSGSLDNQNKLKELLDNIAKIRKAHEGLIKQDPSSTLITPSTSSSSDSDAFCNIESQQDCEASCSKPELCRPCFKSKIEGFGVKCLNGNP